MQLIVKGKQIDVGDALRSHVATHLEASVGKYFSNPIEATVIFSREAHLYRSQITCNAGRGIQFQGHAEADAPYPAFDLALDHLAKRLRRQKRKMRDHHAREADDGAYLAAQYAVLAAPVFDDGDEDEDSGAPPANGKALEMVAGADGHGGLIIAEMPTEVATLTVSEAVERLDLGGMSALLFRNRSNGGLNMLYRRPDGNLGWIDPANLPTNA